MEVNFITWFTELIDYKYKQELQRILNKPNARHDERTFLASFLFDTLGWNEDQIISCIKYYNYWTNFHLDRTTREVNMICDKKRKGLLPSPRFRPSDFYDSDETKTQGGVESNSQRICFADCRQKRVKQDLNDPCLLVSRSDTSLAFNSFGTEAHQIMGDEERRYLMANLKEKKVHAKINNGSKYYKLATKEMQKGTDLISFLSLECGKVAYSESNEPFYCEPDKFFTLPNKPETLKELATAIMNIAEPTKAKK